jgi:parallel beta-helix repeat protein
MYPIQKKFFIILLGLLIALLSLSFVQAQTSLTFNITRQGTTNTYSAVSQTSPASYSGSLKSVVESAVNQAVLAGGGNIIFAAGNFDLGTSYFNLTNIHHITFAGQGIDVTTLRNSTDAAADTEPFNCTNCDYLIIRDMTVFAGGSIRTTSDALDFDDGDGILVERVKVSSTRGRAIVFDGKGMNGHANNNIVRNCIITGRTPLDGIQFLASSNNRVEGCTISGVTRHGIYMAKASSVSPQPNKPSNNNVIVNNFVTNSGGYGIFINGSSQNVITGNTIRNNAFSGIQITTSLAIPCNDNVIDLNSSTQNAEYGLKISSPDCKFNTIRNNDFANNMLGPFLNNGTGTIYIQSSTATKTATPIPSSTASSSTLVVNTVGDSYVSDASPSSNFGSRVALKVNSSPRINSYLRFDVPSLPGNVSRVVLRVYATSASSTGYTVHSTSNAWSERTITFSNAPSFGSSLGSKSGINANSWTEVDLTSVVRAQGQYSFVLKSVSNTLTSFSSREGGFIPQLVISYVGTASTATRTAMPSPSYTPSVSTNLVLQAVKDSFVSASSPSSNNGASSTLRTDAEPITRSYLSFDVPSFSGTIVSATLRVYATSANPTGYSVYRSSNNWAEGTLSYSNAPAVGSLLGNSGAVSTNTWTQVNVTGYITAAGQYTFIMASSSSTATVFSSRTGGHAPELIISLAGSQASVTVPLGIENAMIVEPETVIDVATMSITATEMPTMSETAMETVTEVPSATNAETEVPTATSTMTEVPTATETEMAAEVTPES